VITDQGLLSGHQCRHLHAPRGSIRSQRLGCGGIKLALIDKGPIGSRIRRNVLCTRLPDIPSTRRRLARWLTVAAHVVDDLIPP